jgi:flagellar hook protein FlgE
MSILGAMYAAVSGLGAQSTKLGAISDNIANTSTTGYKRVEVEFASLVTEQVSKRSYSAGGVAGNVRRRVDAQGILQATGSSTDIAINGDGFFVVSDTQNANPQQDLTALTRAGSFTTDDQGFLRNAAGYYLMGFALNPDGTTGQSEPGARRARRRRAGERRRHQLHGRTDDPGHLRRQPAGPARQRHAGGADQHADPVFHRARQLRHLDACSGRRRPIASPTTGTCRSSTARPAAARPRSTTRSSAFNDTGAQCRLALLYPGIAGGSLPLSVNGGLQAMNLDIGEVNDPSGVTQFAGRVRADEDQQERRPLRRGQPRRSQRGTASSPPSSTTACAGRSTRSDRGRAEPQRPVGPRRHRLRPEPDSGSLYLWDAGVGPAGKTAGNSLERSNVDIAQELTNMIETQRTYSTNAKVIQTSDEMLSELTQLKR